MDPDMTGSHIRARRSALLADLDRTEVGDPSRQRAAERWEGEQRRNALPARELTGIRAFIPPFFGIFVYLVCYGMLLTFGVLALVAVTVGFATFASPATGSAATSSLSNVGDNAAGIATGIRTMTRVIVFGAAFLSLWPAWFGSSVARRHFEEVED